MAQRCNDRKGGFPVIPGSSPSELMGVERGAQIFVKRPFFGEKLK